MVSPYLTPVVKFTACSFGHLTSTHSTQVFYRCTLESILTGSSIAHKTLNCSIRTGNIACWVTFWSLSLWSVQCSFGHCHSAVFTVPYGHCHSAPYLHSAVVMNVPGPRTASRQNDAAASHSCHFNTVLYPRSYSECQLPLNCSHRDIPGAASSVQNYRDFFFSHSVISTGNSPDLSTHIML